MLSFALIISLFGIYISTICPTVYLGDSGELTAAAFSLGIPHFSGYPLYTLLGKLFCLIPIGNIAFRMNLMSACFGILTVWLVYSFIYKITTSEIAAFFGSLVLAFTPLLWWQTVAAEVYTLHSFFVVLLIRLLWWWDERRDFTLLLLFVFMTGISFGNHMQTVMLAPAVLFIVLSVDKKALFSTKNFIGLSVIFVVALSIYLYLPIRTGAGAAIHWGDPDNLERFLAHVTGRSHRHGYVFNKTPLEYLYRTKEAFWFVGSQFGLILLLALWGWLKLGYVRWRVFFVLVIFFDFVYTIFLNYISLEITPFTLPTSIVLAILVGFGIAQALKACGRFQGIGTGTQRVIKGAFCLIPVISLFLNYGLSDQSRNYTAYEHALNIFRTMGYGDTLFMSGDNFVFPVTYGRMVERMRGDVRLYDRLNLIFKIPNMEAETQNSSTTWEDQRNDMEEKIIEEKKESAVFYAVFGPYSLKMPGQYRLFPHGVIHRAVEKEPPLNSFSVGNIWSYYASESFYENFERDFMNREVCAYFHFSRGKCLVLLGRPSLGLNHIQLASRIGYDDNLIHSDMAIFLVDNGFFEEARLELEKALIYYNDLSGVHNNWGYYYHKTGEYSKSITAFRKALELSPNNFGYHNNLAFALYEAGITEEAFRTFQRSLTIKADQPDVVEFMKTSGLAEDVIN